MKKLLFGVASILLMASCSGNNDASKKDGEDSDRTSDSIAQVDTQNVIAEQPSPEAGPQDDEQKVIAEQATPEADPQDDVQKDEEFAKVVKALERMPEDKDKIGAYLKNLGFKGNKTTSKKMEDYLGDKIEVEVEKYHYTLTMGDKSITYSLDYEDTLAFGSSTEKITIEGDEEALENYYRFAKKKDAEVKKKGNTVIIKESWA